MWACTETRNCQNSTRLRNCRQSRAACCATGTPGSPKMQAETRTCRVHAHGRRSRVECCMACVGTPGSQESGSVQE
eukprot:scaffold123489_cov14-Tisochrysis_lutea.AAC.2